MAATQPPSSTLYKAKSAYPSSSSYVTPGAEGCEYTRWRSAKVEAGIFNTRAISVRSLATGVESLSFFVLPSPSTESGPRSWSATRPEPDDGSIEAGGTILPDPSDAPASSFSGSTSGCATWSSAKRARIRPCPGLVSGETRTPRTPMQALTSVRSAVSRSLARTGEPPFRIWTAGRSARTSVRTETDGDPRLAASSGVLWIRSDVSEGRLESEARTPGSSIPVQATDNVESEVGRPHTPVSPVSSPNTLRLLLCARSNVSSEGR